MANLYRARNSLRGAKLTKAILFPTFEVPVDYNYNLSTEDNHCCENTQNNNETVHCNDESSSYYLEREVLDYTYHKYYSHARQQYQDSLMNTFFNTLFEDGLNTCLTPKENWLVFTAGPMGAGKSHTIAWLNREGLFPLKAFIQVDPDIIRGLLPETQQYTKIDPTTTGRLTQKEVGYISEVNIFVFYSICCETSSKTINSIRFTLYFDRL